MLKKYHLKKYVKIVHVMEICCNFASKNLKLLYIMKNVHAGDESNTPE